MLETEQEVAASAVMVKVKNLFAATAAASVVGPFQPEEVMPDVTGVGAVNPEPRTNCEKVRPGTDGTVANACVDVLQPL